MTDSNDLIKTGITNLDTILGGGLPVYSLNVLAGSPGVGKTILTQQILFSVARANPGAKVIYMSTLSEPVVKVMRFVRQFDFYDQEIFENQLVYRDLGALFNRKPLNEVTAGVLAAVEEVEATLLVLDSFKAIRDLTADVTEFRRFCYELSINLASAQCTTILVGEYEEEETGTGLEFAVTDGIIFLGMQSDHGENQRYLQVKKLRGQNPFLSRFPFTISLQGIRVFNPSFAIRRRDPIVEVENRVMPTGISGLDELLQGGIPMGRTVIVSGVSGTGKTTAALQFLVTGALLGERGILFSFEESADRLRYIAASFGWDLAALETQGLLRIIFVPQTDINLDRDLEEMSNKLEEFRPQRMVVDSFSVFLYRVEDAATQREKTYLLSTLVQRLGAVGILISDVPADQPGRVSRFGVEETVADGTIVLSSDMVNLQRRRYLEIIKMRAANHVTGRHRMAISDRGLKVFYNPPSQVDEHAEPLPLPFATLAPLLGTNLYHGGAWLLRGDPGSGKTTLAGQFMAAGLAAGGSALLLSNDVPVFRARQALQRAGIDVEAAQAAGRLRILDGFSDEIGSGDPQEFLYRLAAAAVSMPRPLRMVIDSLTPQEVTFDARDFAWLIHRKNRRYRLPDVTLFDVMRRSNGQAGADADLLSAYDVVVDLMQVEQPAPLAVVGGPRLIQVRKARSVLADYRPYPYDLVTERGLVIDSDTYERMAAR